MAQKLDLRGIAEEDKCENAKEVASRVGIQVLCNDEDAMDAENPDDAIHVPDYDGCENTVKVASKLGVQIVCDDNSEK
jgi:hypothetical protein